MPPTRAVPANPPAARPPAPGERSHNAWRDWGARSSERERRSRASEGGWPYSCRRGGGPLWQTQHGERTPGLVTRRR
eukprot:11180433-Lingulodinium_polyedra.AAC.1